MRGILTPAMIDKRLRQLDQDVSIVYWRDALSRSDERDREKTRRTMMASVDEACREESRMTLAEDEDTTRPGRLDVPGPRVNSSKFRL